MENSRKLSAKTILMNVLEELLHKKTFQKISVNELCESALVSRSSFYANFNDKYDLLARCLESKTEEINRLIETHSPEEFFAITLDFIQKEHHFFYNACAAELDEEILDILYTFFERQFTAILNDQAAKGLLLPGPVEVVSSFCVGGITTSTLRWIKSGYKIPKEELAACQYRLLKGIL